MTIEEIAKALDISIEEVKQMQEDDKRINKGEKLFELPKELEKGSKKARQVFRKVGVKQERTKTVDVNKRTLMNAIIELLENFSDNGTIDVENIEREITFKYKSKKYKIVLSCPRS